MLVWVSRDTSCVRGCNEWRWYWTSLPDSTCFWTPASEDVCCLGLPTDQWGTRPLLYKALVSRFTGTLIFLIDWSVCRCELCSHVTDMMGRFNSILTYWFSVSFSRRVLWDGLRVPLQVVTVVGISRAVARSRPEGWFWLLLFRLCWDRSFFDIVELKFTSLSALFFTANYHAPHTACDRW